MTTELVLHRWEISCMHTGETIDKLVMNFRKRGMLLEFLSYKKLDEYKAICIIEFEDSVLSAERIFSNLQRLEDVIEVKK